MRERQRCASECPCGRVGAGEAQWAETWARVIVGQGGQPGSGARAGGGGGADGRARARRDRPGSIPSGAWLTTWHKRSRPNERSEQGPGGRVEPRPGEQSGPRPGARAGCDGSDSSLSRPADSAAETGGLGRCLAGGVARGRTRNEREQRACRGGSCGGDAASRQPRAEGRRGVCEDAHEREGAGDKSARGSVCVAESGQVGCSRPRPGRGRLWGEAGSWDWMLRPYCLARG